MKFIGYIDDSGDQKECFTLSCVLAERSTWHRITFDLKRLLAKKNEKLKLAGRPILSRYKAADCSSRVGEFAGWSAEEQMDLTTRLLTLVRKQKLIDIISFSLNLRELAEELSWTSDRPLWWAHKLLLTDVMLETSAQFLEAGPTVEIKTKLVHDRSNYEEPMRQAFNQLMKDPTFGGKSYFTNIASMGWEACFPLQIADLMAYENFKETERRETRRDRRYTLKQLLEMKCFSGRSRGYDRKGLAALAAQYKKINPHLE